MDTETGPRTRRWSERTSVVPGTRDGHQPDPFPEVHLINFRRPWLISLFFGMVGADRFYLRRPVSGAVKLLTLGGMGLWWAADVLAIALGPAVDGGGHPMEGRPGHRAAALAVSLMVIASVFTLAGGPALAALRHTAGAATTAFSSALPSFPSPEKRPVWTKVADLAGGPGAPSIPGFTLTEDVVRIRYTLDGPGFLYLLPAGSVEVPDGAEPTISTLEARSGELILRTRPGGWVLLAQPLDASWSATIEQFSGSTTG